MNREQMIAWLILEGWNPTKDGDLVHKSECRYATPRRTGEFTTRVGAFTSGDMDQDWESWVRQHPGNLEACYAVLSRQMP